MVTRRGFEPLYDSVKGCCVKPLHQRANLSILYGAVGETRTRTGRPATPSRWCVCQFHHDRKTFKPQSRSRVYTIRFRKSIRFSDCSAPIFIQIKSVFTASILPYYMSSRNRSDRVENFSDIGKKLFRKISQFRHNRQYFLQFFPLFPYIFSMLRGKY